jgi:signal transduction histidine kinase
MPNINLFAISGLLIVITYLPLFLFILIKGKTRIARIYSLHIFSIFIWGFGALLIGTNTRPEIAYKIWRFAYIGTLFIPTFLQHTVLLMTKKKSRAYIVFVYGQAIFFVFCMLNNKMISETKIMFNSFYVFTATPTYIISFIIWAVITLLAHIQLILYYKTLFPQEKRKVLALILSIIGFIGGASNFLPPLGINLYPLGNFLIPIPSFIITYAILEHQLLDIKPIFKQGVIYSIFIATISIIYLIIVISIERILQVIVGYRSAFGSIITAFIIGVLFFPIRNRIQYLIDKYFFKGSQLEIVEQNKLLRQEIAQTEKYKTLSTLATGIAHEVKNPLTAIKTFTEFLPQRLEDKEFLSKFADIVGREVNRIDQMVHQLLDYGKPAPLSLQKTDIHKLINDTTDILSSKFIDQKIKVSKSFYANQNLQINIDPNQLRQALLNILLNAIEAMPNSGRLKIETKQSSKNFEIVISDTGHGIPKEDLPQIFDPFFSRKDHGTGLGLAITQSLIENHKGTIKVRSAVGSGTEVKIKLPLGHTIPE